MSERLTIQLWEPVQAWKAIGEAWKWAKGMLLAGNRLVLTLRKETRSLKQNNLMWSCLGDLSKQVTWYGKKLTPEGWKDFITGHLNGQELMPNMDGTGFISINRGRSTSDMTIAEMTAVIDLCHAFGSQQGVNWSPTSLGEQAMEHA
jgi:hypothetical protein